MVQSELIVMRNLAVSPVAEVVSWISVVDQNVSGCEDHDYHYKEPDERNDDLELRQIGHQIWNEV